jgi:hypothetical protein
MDTITVIQDVKVAVQVLAAVVVSAVVMGMIMVIQDVKVAAQVLAVVVMDTIMVIQDAKVVVIMAMPIMVMVVLNPLVVKGVALKEIFSYFKTPAQKGLGVFL